MPKIIARALGDVLQVDVYHNSVLQTRYHHTKSTLIEHEGLVDEVWVFHSTPLRNIDSIMTRGFLIGGVDVPLVNGQSYGPGIYTSKSPVIAMRYASNDKVMVLSKGLIESESGAAVIVGGNRRPVNVDEIVIFKDGRLLLPKYIIHYNG